MGQKVCRRATKEDFAAKGLVLPPGPAEDSLHQTCSVCKCVVFWRLTTLCAGNVLLCDWCMAASGKRRMRGSRPLVAAKATRATKRRK